MRRIKMLMAAAVTAVVLGLGGVATASPVRGTLADTEMLGSGDREVYTINFRGGESADVTLAGDGRTNLDLYIFDENGNLIEKSTAAGAGYGDHRVLSFTPRWTGAFKIVVVNTGSVSNGFRIVMD